MISLRILLLLFTKLLLLLSNGLYAVENSFPKYLEGDEPSYFVYVPSEESTNRDAHVEFFLSIRYPISDKTFDRLIGCTFDLQGLGHWKDCLLGEVQLDKESRWDHKLYFVYNGQYDFFSGTRNSSPIVSRRQNPGVSYKVSQVKSPSYIKHIKLSWFHESNGQYLDEEAYNDALANGENLFELNSRYGLNARDHISRGWDYAELELAFNWQSLDATMKYRNHCDCQAFGMEDKEDNIFWDPANTNRGGITEFKGLDVIASYTYRLSNDIVNWIRLSYQFGTGEFDYFGKNITQKYALTVRVVELPFTLFYFDGYGEDIAQYHLRSQYIGVGFEFW